MDQNLMTKKLQTEVLVEIRALKTELKSGLKELRYNLTVRLGVVIAAYTAIVSAIIILKY